MFILGGYIATAEQWEKLTAAWQAILDQPPRISYFSAREAYSLNGKLRGQFNRFTQAERDEKVALFRSAIERFLTAEISLGFQMELYEEAFFDVEKLNKSPYYFAIPQLEMFAIRNMEKFGLPQQEIEFIYDNRKIEEPLLLDA